jgi:hypothetical protein
VAALQRIAPDLETAKDFHSVFVLVDAAFKPVFGAGELAVYDATDRICERLGHSSPHVVYLHNGTRVGARRLAGGRLANEDAWGILHRQLPEGLRGLSTQEAEDVLCIYKDDFLLSPKELHAKWETIGGSRCKSHGPGVC